MLTSQVWSGRRLCVCELAACCMWYSCSCSYARCSAWKYVLGLHFCHLLCSASKARQTLTLDERAKLDKHQHLTREQSSTSTNTRREPRPPDRRRARRGPKLIELDRGIGLLSLGGSLVQDPRGPARVARTRNGTTCACNLNNQLM